MIDSTIIAILSAIDKIITIFSIKYFLDSCNGNLILFLCCHNWQNYCLFCIYYTHNLKLCQMVCIGVAFCNISILMLSSKILYSLFHKLLFLLSSYAITLSQNVFFVVLCHHDSCFSWYWYRQPANHHLMKVLGITIIIDSVSIIFRQFWQQFSHLGWE